MHYVLLAAITAVTLALAGCVNSKQTYTADGSQGHVINCTPAWTGGIVGQVAASSTSWGTCYEKAGEICGPAGYDIVQQVGENGAYGQGGGGGGFVSTTNNRTLIVKCKGQGGPGAPVTAAVK